MSVAWSPGKEPEADTYITTVSVPEFDNGRPGPPPDREGRPVPAAERAGDIMSAAHESRPLPTVPEFLARLFTPAAGSPVMYIGPCDRPAPEITESPKLNEPGNREPIPIREVIRAFLNHPERFTADTFPEPPEAA